MAGSVWRQPTSFALLLAYVTLFCVGVVSFCLLVSVFFSNAKLAAVLAPILFFGAVLPKYVFFGSNRYERTTDKLWASLLLPSAFSFGADILADYEYAEIGVTLENMHEGDYSFASCLFMLCVDTVLYTLLYLYLERVLPSRYGSREHPLFFLIPSWWLSDGSISTTRAARPRMLGLLALSYSLTVSSAPPMKLWADLRAVLPADVLAELAKCERAADSPVDAMLVTGFPTAPPPCDVIFCAPMAPDAPTAKLLNPAGEQMGIRADANDPDGQSAAMAAVGSTDWIHLDADSLASTASIRTVDVTAAPIAVPLTLSRSLS